jgi:hypothetical protein
MFSKNSNVGVMNFDVFDAPCQSLGIHNINHGLVVDIVEVDGSACPHDPTQLQ